MAVSALINPSFQISAGFTNAQFKKLDDLYCRAASEKILSSRSVECDFDEGLARYTYYKSQYHPPVLQFVIRKVGPRAVMYEVYQHSKGRIAKSGVFDMAFERLREEIGRV